MKRFFEKAEKCFIKSGIYGIINLIDGKIYVGGTLYFYKRWAEHRCLLNQNKHHNNYLQHAWNKYWCISFEFIVLEYVEDKELLLEREQFWLDKTKCYERDKGYNLRRIANSNYGIELSDDHKLKISIANKGKKPSKEALLKNSLAQIGNQYAKGSIRSIEFKEALRNRTKWPCDDGSKCKCQNCGETRNFYKRKRLIDNRVRIENVL